MAAALWFATGGKIASINSDLDLYNHFVVARFPDHISELSKAVELGSPRIEALEHFGWTPTPFYSLIFLLPVWLFGSNFLLWLEGLALGVLTIWCAAKVVEKLGVGIPAALKSLVVLAFPLNFNFLVDSVGVSTMSVAAAFVMAAVVVESRLLRAALLVFAAMTRVNYLFFALAFLISGLIFRPKGWVNCLIDAVPSLVVYIVFYKFYYSTYPGGGLNYVLMASFQGLDYAIPESSRILARLSGSASDALSYRLNLGDLLALLVNLDSLTYVFNLSALKLSVTLGLVHEKLFQSDWGFYLAKVWRTVYFSFAMMPGFYASALLVFARGLGAWEKTGYAWIVLYLVMNSLLIGDPRYLMGVYLVLLIK